MTKQMITEEPQPAATVAVPEIQLAEVAEVLPIYHKCLTCADLGRLCGGQKLATLGGTESVRTYHRLLKQSRKIQLKAIYSAAPQIGHGTIDEYFGRGGQDFKWTTVSSIDAALVAICGDRVGLPPLESFCPADAVDMRSRNEALAARLSEAEGEIARLTETIRAAETSHVAQMREQRTVFQSQVEFAVERMQEADRRAADYLARNDDKRQLIDTLHKEIRSLNSQILKMAGDHAAEIRMLVDRVIDLTNQRYT